MEGRGQGAGGGGGGRESSWDSRTERRESGWVNTSAKNQLVQTRRRDAPVMKLLHQN